MILIPRPFPLTTSTGGFHPFAVAKPPGTSPTASTTQVYRKDTIPGCSGQSTFVDCWGIRSSVITLKAANSYQFKTGQRKWPSRTENVLPCRLLWWQVGFGAPAPRAALEHVPVV